MNRPIVRLYGLIVVLFALLVAFTSRWTVFEASSLRSNPENHRGLLEQERIDRGPIVAAAGSTLARSVRGSEGDYSRVYPDGSLFANVVGYHYIRSGSTGLERYWESNLSGHSTDQLQTILNQLQGTEPVGEKLVSTLVPSAQRVAAHDLTGQRGAVVAIEPRSGAVEVMASSPSYDPNQMESFAGAKKIEGSPGSPLLNRALQDGYAPGSTFKVVTATAAIDSGQYTPESTVSGKSGILVSGVPLNNDHGESFGQITLTQALVHSVNTVWAQVALHLGRATMRRYMERFGFDSKPQLDYPSQEMSASGEYLPDGRLVPATDEAVDLGRMGIGQDKLQATALQMAEVASAVGNHGVLMRPHLAARIVDPEGRIERTITPHVQSVVMQPSTAAAVRGMMEAVVQEGTGTAARIPGVKVAGKTGTAQTEEGQTINNVWFIAFAPAQDPTVAVAVTLQDVPGEGATFAAPIAREVIESLLHEGSTR